MKQRTYVMIKYDGVQRSLVGEIISRLERTGLKIVAMKMFVPDRERLLKHYGKDDQWLTEKGQNSVDSIIAQGGQPEKSAKEYGQDIIDHLIQYMSAGPAVALVFEGHEAVRVVKKIVGGTQPTTSDVGTIRGDFTVDSYELANLQQRAVRNLIHCTGDPSEAEFEVNLWFKKEELIGYPHINELMLYDVNVDGLFE